MATINTDSVQRLYVAYFNRPADPLGLQYWESKLSSTTVATQTQLAAIAAGFSGSAEYAALYAGQSYTQIVNNLYLNLFGRNAELAGLNAWASKLQAGTETFASIALQLTYSAQGTDATAIANKLAASKAFTAAIDTTAETLGYAGTAAAASARSWLATITDDAASFATATTATAVNTAVSNAVNAVSIGQTFRLTENIDNITAGVGNDTIDATLMTTVAGRLQTWNNSDSINGGTGTDTLVAQLVTGGVTVGSLSNVEILDVEAQGMVTVDLNTADGSLTTIKSSNSGANNLTIQNIQSAPSNFAITNSTGNFTATVINSKLAGAADAATLALSNVTAGTVTLQTSSAASGYETLNIQSNGSLANVLTGLTDGNGTSLTTVNFSGSQNLTLPLLDTSITNANASGMTGRLMLTVAAANTQNMAITGGSADDVINMNGTYTSADTINGGIGNDRLMLTNTEATAATTAQSNVSSIEVIGLSDGLSGTVAVNNFNATGLQFGANMAGGGIVNYAAGTNSLDIQHYTGNTSLTVNIAGSATNDILNMNIGSTNTGNTFGAVGVIINGAETVNLLSQGGTNNFGAEFTLTDTATTQSLTLTGSQNITFAGAVRSDVINASGMSGTATLTLAGGTGTSATTITGTVNADILNGSTTGDIIDGGSGNDTIANAINGTAATAGDVLTGGSGFDTFILRGDAASATLTTALSQAVYIGDFTVGASASTTDILSLSATHTNYSGAGTGFHTGISTVAAGSSIIQNVAQNAVASAMTTGLDLVKLTTGIATTGLTTQAAFDAAIGSATITGLGVNTEAFVSMYDTTSSRMLLMVVDAAAGTNTAIESGDVVTLIGSVGMSASDYASFSAVNFALIAA